MLVKYYQLTEDELQTKPLEEGSLCLTNDTNRFYLDLVGGGRALLSADPIVLSTEIERENLLSPIPNKLYFVTESSIIYVYYNDTWHGYTEPVQSDFNQTDETKPDYIKNKPNKNDALELIAEMGLIEPVAADDGSIYTDNDGNLYTF